VPAAKITSELTPVDAENTITKTTVTEKESQRESVIKQAETQQSLVLAEIEPHLFSKDNYVEILSLRTVIGFCNEPDRVTEIFTIYGEIHPQQLTWIDQSKTDCQLYTERYPELLQALESKEFLANLNPSSDLGHLLKNRKFTSDKQARQANNLSSLAASLGAKNSVQILSANQRLRFDRIDLKNQFQMVDCQDRRYIHAVNQIAINLIACDYQAGVACQRTSSMMMTTCAQFPAACGLDFNTLQKNSWVDFGSGRLPIV